MESQFGAAPGKCAFGAQEVKYLGHLVTHAGIRACPSKIKAIVEMARPARKRSPALCWEMPILPQVYPQHLAGRGALVQGTDHSSRFCLD